jgi:hypothetical protein
MEASATSIAKPHQAAAATRAFPPVFASYLTRIAGGTGTMGYHLLA